MLKRLLAIAFIFMCTTGAWMVLGGTIFARTYSSDLTLKSRVERIWGTAQAQRAPSANYKVQLTREEESIVDGKKVTVIKKTTETYSVPLTASDIAVKLALDYRQKGLLWYSTYVTDFTASYRFRLDGREPRTVYVAFPFPAQAANYDDFRFVLRGGAWANKPETRNGQMIGAIAAVPGQDIVVDVGYRTQGLDQWRYLFTGHEGENATNPGVTEVRDFRLVMETDFRDIDFPDDSIAPSSKERTHGGWRLTWKYKNLIAGVNIGMLMPQKLQPGPLAGQISFFAPVSLFFFTVVLLALSLVRRIELHPMHFFFLSAAFFAFHLLLAYLVDHVSIHTAFVIASAVSIGLVVSYLRTVVGPRFAFVPAMSAQLIFLVLFSYAFFFTGLTGLTMTIGAVLTLFVLMRMTARIDWTIVFAKK